MADSKLGLTSKTFIAGSPHPSGHWDRVHAIDSADVIHAHYEDRNDRWWGDVAYASGKGKYVVVTEDRMSSLMPEGVPMLARIRGHQIHFLKDRADGLLAAAALASHDPKCTAAGFQDGDELVQMLKRCESPIEARLGCHLLGRITSFTVCKLRTQERIGSYRADFVITNESLEGDGPGDDEYRKMMDYAGPIRIVIECDGHAFHERTKDQAARDKRRDRDLQTAGWRVLRFTGSEIWADPQKRVDEVIECIKAMGGLIG